MSVDSVSSSGNAAASSAARSQVRLQQPEQEQSAQKVASERARAEREVAKSAPVEAEKPRPTINTSGQAVGSRIDTSA